MTAAIHPAHLAGVIVCLAAIAGLAIAGLLLYLPRRTRDRIHTPDDLSAPWRPFRHKHRAMPFAGGLTATKELDGPDRFVWTCYCRCGLRWTEPLIDDEHDE